jgi:hypothetical protein
MKIIFSLFALMMVTESCNSTKEATSNSQESESVVASRPSKETVESNDKNYHDKTAVTYKATSRGYFTYVQVSENEIQVSSDRALMKIDSYTIKENDWLEVNKLIKAINLETFQKLEAPTDKRLFDGAPHTTLSLIKGDVVYITPTFDEGHPPAEIEKLVNKVLSIKENAIKQ